MFNGFHGFLHIYFDRSICDCIYISTLVTKLQRWLYSPSKLTKANQCLFVSPADAGKRDLIAVLQEGPLLVTDLERLLPAFCCLKQTAIFSRLCTANGT